MTAALKTSPGGRVQRDSLNVVSMAAERQRRHRERLRQGKIQLVVEVDQRLIEALLVTTTISESESLSRHAIEAALGEMIDDWTARALS